MLHLLWRSSSALLKLTLITLGFADTGKSMLRDPERALVTSELMDLQVAQRERVFGFQALHGIAFGAPNQLSLPHTTAACMSLATLNAGRFHTRDIAWQLLVQGHMIIFNLKLLSHLNVVARDL